MARPLLPSLTSLQCFEASARHLSFTRAADELSLTQSAVSKQVAHLESLLERQLFRRVRKRLQLSPEGAVYLADARKLLAQAEMSTRKMRSFSTHRQDLLITAPPTFGTRWLVPRLNGFRFRHPEIDLMIRERVNTFELGAEDIDAAFFFGHGAWPDAECIHLVDETLIPVCSPTLMPDTTLKSPLALTQLVLLQINSRPECWHDWFEAQGFQTDYSYHGPQFDTFSMALAAARAGCGVALVPRLFAQQELDRGELIVPWAFEQRSSDAYYLTYPEHKGELARVKALVSWILEQCETVAASA